jgi:glycerol-3-phosphate dehydrogenase
VHLIFDLKRIPIQGAMVMSHPVDGRIAFVIPRPDFGSGVVVVGTTDGPAPADPSRVDVNSKDAAYLLDLLQRYFPELKLRASDILSAYVGVRPLVGGDDASIEKLQKVSREHHIDQGPGGTTVVAGGKYTTYRKMAEEIVEFTLKHWKEGKLESLPNPRTREPINPMATPEAIAKGRLEAAALGIRLPEELIERYGANALLVKQMALSDPAPELPWPAGFPDLGAQLRYSIRYEMTLHLRDFYFRRLPLFASRADHGMPWAQELSRIWAQELGKSEGARISELELLKKEVDRHSGWISSL